MGCCVIGCVGETPPRWNGLPPCWTAQEAGLEVSPPRPPCPLMGVKGWLIVAAAAATLGPVICIR
eukprot:11072030-Alexandrium_andersonii.AAC.1